MRSETSTPGVLEVQNLRPGEKIELVVRRHWIIFLFLGLYFIIGILISIIEYYVFGFTIVSNMMNIVFWLFYSLFLYIEWLNHELDLFVISNNRIIGVEQIKFLNRTVSECNLGQVQEVNSNTKGFLANMLNYGTLTIQTAGNITTMQMDYCPDSMQQARKILNIVDVYRDARSNNTETNNITKEENNEKT